MALKNGRISAEDLLVNQKDGSYLVRPSSQQENCYAISLKDKDSIQHILIETVLTGTGVQLTLSDKQKHFDSLKDLLDFYHVKKIFGLYTLRNIILPKTKDQVHSDQAAGVQDTLDLAPVCQIAVTCVPPLKGDINPVFIEMFCGEIENARNLALEQDIADRLGIGQPFVNYKCSFVGINSSRSHRMRWILEMWMQREGDGASIEKFEKTLSNIKDAKKIVKKLRPFSKPW